MLSGLGPATRAVLSQLRSLADAPHEIEVEFAVKLTADARIVIAHAGGEANFRIMLKWARPPDQSSAVDGERACARVARELPYYDDLEIRLTPGRENAYNVEIAAASGARGHGAFAAPSELDVERFRLTVDPRNRRVRGPLTLPGGRPAPGSSMRC